MILPLLVSAAVAAAPVARAPDVHALLAGASHAARVHRLDQANLMLMRAVSAGAKGPELDHAIADLAYASGKYEEALARYQAWLKAAPQDGSALESAGIAALKLGKLDRASSLLEAATARPNAGWRAWNALGAVSDLNANWAKADECYDHASQLAPKVAGPVNNRGWSLLLRGDWQKALEYFERATVLNPKSERIANNLDLARSALAAELPRREAGETDSSWAARLNDAGLAAAILGDRTRATAAFTQALNASGTWYARAANNLEAMGSR
jgi:Flp pilus assembly protein TadD